MSVTVIQDDPGYGHAHFASFGRGVSCLFPILFHLVPVLRIGPIHRSLPCCHLLPGLYVALLCPFLAFRLILHVHESDRVKML